MRILRPVSLTVALAALWACGPVAEPAATPPPVSTVPAAEGDTCVVPPDVRPARPYAIPQDEAVRDVPVAYHLLAVSWSPQACRTGRDYPDQRLQCADNRFGLTLHGLWPNGAESRHPRYCATQAPALRPETVRRHFCMTPSPRLMQHEWAAHGTCGWESAEAYYADAARLWDALVKPDLEAIPADRLTAGAIRDAFAAANPGLPRRAVIVVLADDDAFREVRLCYSRDLAPMACPRGLGPPDRVRVTLASRGA